MVSLWWRQLESEPRPASGAASCPPLPMVATEWRSSLILAACTWLLIQTISTKNKTEPINRLCLFMVETVGIEPMTSCMSSMRSNQLSYASATDGIIPHAEGFVKGFLKSFLEIFKKQVWGNPRIYKEIRGTGHIMASLGWCPGFQ